ncbi:MAG: hypothetical protein J7D61_07850 [Marichromatium sp.]|nr:hypothetical protein [Marichromatium sp.]
MQNPFEHHADAVLAGSYGISQALQEVVLSLWNGQEYRVDLGRLARGTDQRHYAIVMEMLAWYREHGEDDPAFRGLALTLLERSEGSRGSAGGP